MIVLLEDKPLCQWAVMSALVKGFTVILPLTLQPCHEILHRIMTKNTSQHMWKPFSRHWIWDWHENIGQRRVLVEKERINSPWNCGSATDKKILGIILLKRSQWCLFELLFWSETPVSAVSPRGHVYLFGFSHQNTEGVRPDLIQRSL